MAASKFTLAFRRRIRLAIPLSRAYLPLNVANRLFATQGSSLLFGKRGVEGNLVMKTLQVSRAAAAHRIDMGLKYLLHA